MGTEYTLGQFHDIDRLIVEYEEDNRAIKKGRMVMVNYPKVFIMSAASFFEFQIKKCLEEFIDHPIDPIDTHYSLIATLSRRNPRKPLADSIFSKLEGYTENGTEVLDAEKFYQLFGGDDFKSKVSNRVNTLIDEEKAKIEAEISHFIPILSLVTDEKYELEYAKMAERKDQLSSSTFESSEQSYLNLKLRRNRVAHDYLNGSSDTFEDILKFYNSATLYVVALENSIAELTEDVT